MMDYAVGHATTAPIADDVVIREPMVVQHNEFATPAPTLNAQEIAFFKANGYIAKRGLVNSTDAFSQVIEHLWRHVPRGVLKRDDPNTWLNAPHEQWTDEDAERVGRLIDTNWKMRSRGSNGIGTEPFLVNDIARHPNMLAVVEALIGKPVRPPRRVRGIYAVLPKPPAATHRLGVHADYMAAQLVAMVLVHDVRPRCGGFTVWPGSHLRLHPHWDKVQGTTISEAKSEGFRRERDVILINCRIGTLVVEREYGDA